MTEFHTSGFLIVGLVSKLYKKTIGKHKLERCVEEYHKYHNLNSKFKTRCKNEYYQEQIRTYKKNSRQLWKTCNTLLGKLKQIIKKKQSILLSLTIQKSIINCV